MNNIVLNFRKESEQALTAKERRKKVKALRESGMTFRSIGKEMEISQQRAFQLYYMALRDERDDRLKSALFKDVADGKMREVLSTRAYNALKRMNINNLKELKDADPARISRARNIGKKTFEEIMRVREGVEL